MTEAEREALARRAADADPAALRQIAALPPAEFRAVAERARELAPEAAPRPPPPGTGP